MLTPRESTGFTLVEILIGLVVAAIVGTAVTTIAVRHEHLAFALDQITLSRRALREGADALGYDLRAIAPARKAIYDMSSSYVEFRLEVGFALLCDVDSSRALLVVPARAAGSANLTSWIVAPEPGDTAMIFAAHSDADSARWYFRAIASAPATGRECAKEFVLTGASAPAVGIRLDAPLPPDVGVGAVLRFVRRARYELYKAADGAWYLGFRDCLLTRSTPCATVQPVSGPYAPGGVHFRYLDSTGTSTADPLRVARIDVVLRVMSAGRLHVPGIKSGTFTDSTLFTISPRH